MGQAKRRKAKGNYPEQTEKARKVARMKPDEHPTYGMMGIGDISMLMNSLIMNQQMGATFAIRNATARLNHKREMGIDESSDSDQGNI